MEEREADVAVMSEASVSSVVCAMGACSSRPMSVGGWWVLVAAESAAIRARSLTPVTAWCGVRTGVFRGESTLGNPLVRSVVSCMVPLVV